MKVVINKCYGGFGLSTEAFKKLIELGMTKTTFDEKGCSIDKNADITEHINEFYGDYSFNLNENNLKIRTDKRLIQVIEELGEKANGDCAKLKIIDVPFDDINQVFIENYDGIEWIAEKHRTWS